MGRNGRTIGSEASGVSGGYDRGKGDSPISNRKRIVSRFFFRIGCDDFAVPLIRFAGLVSPKRKVQHAVEALLIDRIDRQYFGELLLCLVEQLSFVGARQLWRVLWSGR